MATLAEDMSVEAANVTGGLGPEVRSRRPAQTDFSCGLDPVGSRCLLRIDDAIVNL